jgi:aminoglycoside 6'-N-acetyltransferase I
MQEFPLENHFPANPCDTHHAPSNSTTMATITITPLDPNDERAIEEIARLLQQNFASAWQEIEEGVEEVREAFGEDRFSFVAKADGEVVGWIGAIVTYNGHSMELHPLVVHQTWQGKGVGRLLVAALEAEGKRRGITTVYLGTDDEDDRTTLAGADLYPNVLENVLTIQNPGKHPYEFYEKCGYVIVGVIPDANGPGKPDIFMAKRL